VALPGFASVCRVAGKNRAEGARVAGDARAVGARSPATPALERE
jgi:hypothetical protein